MILDHIHPTFEPHIGGSGSAMPSLSQQEIAKYWEIFQQQSPSNGMLSRTQTMSVLQNSQLPANQLDKVWELADIDGDGKTDFEEFCIAMRLVFDQLQHAQDPLPATLPSWLAPASKQHLLEAKQALSGNASLSSSNSDSLLDLDDDMSLRTDFNWYISPTDRREYEAVYSVNADNRGCVSFDSFTELYSTLNVPSTDVSSAWNLVNPKSEEKIDKEQCIVFLHMLNQRHQGVRLPRSIPASLRATFGKNNIDYDLEGRSAEIRKPQPTTSSSKSSFAEGYLSRLGLGGRSQNYSTGGTDFSSTKDSDWEEVRLKRELADLDARLAKIENAKEERKHGAGTKTALVRRELQMLLEYKEKQLNAPPASKGNSTDLSAAREEVDMMAEQLGVLKEHFRNREQQLSDLKQELATL